MNSTEQDFSYTHFLVAVDKQWYHYVQVVKILTTQISTNVNKLKTRKNYLKNRYTIQLFLLYTIHIKNSSQFNSIQAFFS